MIYVWMIHVHQHFVLLNSVIQEYSAWVFRVNWSFYYIIRRSLSNHYTKSLQLLFPYKPWSFIMFIMLKIIIFCFNIKHEFFHCSTGKDVHVILCQLSQRFVWEGLVSIILQPRSFTSFYPLACNHKT